ncbi:MAG: hypothetical protein LBV20_00535 [Treponema sp.]|jgi:hypothetical protein|nr:hypothetical protein [Treponema sp.]
MAAAGAWEKLMQEDAGKIISHFLGQLESGNMQTDLFKQFLASLSALPLDLPLLQGIGNFLSGEENNIVTKNIERRCRRISLVQQELEQIDWKVRMNPDLYNNFLYNEDSAGTCSADLHFSKAKPETRFEDFIFEQTDFSIYEKIDSETFSFFYIDGLDDLSDDFYIKKCFRDKSEIRKIISARYKRLDDFYVSDGNPLLIPIMRSIHTSLDFVSFPNQNQFLSEMETLLEFLKTNAALPDIFFQHLIREEDDLYNMLLLLFDKTKVLHNDRMTSSFFIAEEKGMTALFAIFNPGGKAFTKLMAISKVPYGTLN